MCPPRNRPRSVAELLLAHVYANLWQLPDLPELDVESWFGADQLAEREGEIEVWEPGELP